MQEPLLGAQRAESPRAFLLLTANVSPGLEASRARAMTVRGTHADGYTRAEKMMGTDITQIWPAKSSWPKEKASSQRRVLDRKGGHWYSRLASLLQVCWQNNTKIVPNKYSCMTLKINQYLSLKIQIDYVSWKLSWGNLNDLVHSCNSWHKQVFCPPFL